MSAHLHVPAVAALTLGLLSIAPRAWIAPQQPAVSPVTIVGSVVDAGLSPLGGATVALERAGRAQAKTTTDAGGKFTFTNVTPGDYRVRADYPGFSTYSRDLRVRGSVSRLQLPIVLTRPGNALAKTETSGGRGQALQAPAASPPPLANAPRPNANPVAGRAGGGVASGMAIDSLRSVGATVNQAPAAQAYVQWAAAWPGYPPPFPGESYRHVEPNRFMSTLDRPLSTFGADVDTASYTNVRRFLSNGQLPPPDAVRVEEFLNYFRFGYADPRGNQPVGITTEIGECPWAPSHRLVLIGARAKAAQEHEIAGRNLVLLIDVSGSMAPPDRLPLIKSALGMFVDTLRPEDRLAIVTYAGASGLALPSTSAREKGVIQEAIARLTAGGSTNGGQGLIMAYRTAREAFIPGGVNRVILATDGDFNVGIVSPAELLRLIEQEKESGVFLSVFGVGRDNLKDSTLEMLADRGNGHYAYLDSLQEARRVLVREGDATLETVAKDVKFQVEFNPAIVGAWKLIGYEDRRLGAVAFNDDRKDGGALGAGHTVTVLYEVVPAGSTASDDVRVPTRPAVDPLRYQPAPAVTDPAPVPADLSHSGEWLTVKVRYKAPEGDVSNLLAQPVRAGGPVRFLPFASAIAEFGMMLRDGTAEPEQWDALTRRIDRVQVPTSLVAEKSSLVELVAIAGGLSRRR